MSENVYVIGVGHIKFGKNYDKTMKSMTGESLELALKDCNFKKKGEIEAAGFSNSGWGISEMG